MYKYKEDSDCSVVIIASADQHNYIKSVLRDYKLRYERSLANMIGVTDTLDELTFDTIVILPEYMAISVNALRFKKLVTVDAIQNLSHHDLRRATIETHVEVITDLEVASDRLQLLGPVFAFDTETCGITEEDSALDVFNNELTMYSFAEDEENAFVIINEDQDMEDMVMAFLTSTESTVICHNASFDMKIVYHRTGKMIKNFEDTQLWYKSYINNCDNSKAKVGLKDLAGHVYGDWACGPDLFGRQHKMNPDLHHYSGVDAMATWFLYNELNAMDDKPEQVAIPDLFPIRPPSEHVETPRYFYENVLRKLVPSIIRMMVNGIPLDMDKVDKLGHKLDIILDEVLNSLSTHPYVEDFTDFKYEILKKKKTEELLSKKRDIRQYLKDYKHTDTVMRSYVVNTYIESIDVDWNLEFWPADVLPDQTTKWTVNDLKKFKKNNNLHRFTEIIDKTIDPLSDVVVQAMIKLASYKANTYNNSYDIKIDEIDKSIVPPFNPASSLQKREIFEMLDIDPLATSKDSGLASWSRDQIEETLKSTTDEDVKSLCKHLIEFSQAAIIRKTFIRAFQEKTINGVLHGEFRIFGAKTARPTSKNPNLLNLPSTGSIFATPIKECMTAPPGYIVVAVDYGQLEDRVVANLSKDKGKCSVFLNDLDSHCYNSLGYFKSEIAEHIDLTGDPVTDTLAYKKAIDEGNKDLKKIRQKGKPCTFGLSYGSYPPKVASTIKCSITEAEKIFDSYHNELYAGITDFRENKVLKLAKKQGYTHMGLGAKLSSDDIDRDSRTLFNSASQFWSILTLTSLAEFDQAVQEQGKDVKITASIYDAIYMVAKADVETIKWINDILPPLMTKEWIEDEIVHNEAAIEIGMDWSDMTEVPNNADIQQIQEIIDDIR